MPLIRAFALCFFFKVAYQLYEINNNFTTQKSYIGTELTIYILKKKTNTEIKKMSQARIEVARFNWLSKCTLQDGWLYLLMKNLILRNFLDKN